MNFPSIEEFLLRKWAFSSEVCLIALIFTGCIKTRVQDPEKKWHPLRDFIHTFLNTFATGILGPLAVGEVPLPLTNDVVITLLICIWFLFYRMDRIMMPLATSPGIFQLLIFFATLSRANNVCAFTDKAYKRLSTLSSSSYYPIPLLGPIIVGVIRGAGGLIFPPEKGLSSLKKGLPFNAQIALVCSSIWHLVVNDPFVLGGYVRGLLKSFGAKFLLQPVNLKCAIVIFFLFMNVLQSFNAYSEANPFWPCWEVLYRVTGVDRSHSSIAKPKSANFRGLYDYQARKQVQLMYDYARYIFILGTICFHLYSKLPDDHIYPGKILRAGEYLGHCTFLSQFRSCNPTIAVVEDSGRIAIYGAKSPLKAASKSPLWVSANKVRQATSEDGWLLILGEDGVLRLQDGINAKKPTWVSKMNKATKKLNNYNVHGILENEELRIYKADTLCWSSQ